ncbi:Uma2 family endonuclease [Acaryochloris sp. IP29b_bin.148]|uniref:Uma2 family endonuclease n=1 Tax=Acaryochloris sp. IP29b_bin.148 TaxID=2969218 RepID=UPI003454CFB5
MVTQPLYTNLPSTAELPCSDDTPVDNEDQNLLPNLLLFMLCNLWADRMDWYFGVDMAIYHTTGVSPKVPVVPDGFLSLGVERKKGGKSRRSYATWEEQDIVPILTLEMVSHQPGGEYAEKMAIYAKLGVLYYVIYNPEFWQRDRHQPFEVYKLDQGTYHLQIGEPFWLPEVGLGIGRCQQVFGGIEQELLCWYDEQGQSFPTPEETIQHVQSQLQAERQRANAESQRANAESQRANAASQRAEKLAEYLRTQGINPDDIL